MLLRLRALPGMIGWGLRFLRECRPERWEWANTEAVLKLALFSMATLDKLQADEQLAFDRNPPGLIKLFRDPLSMDSALRASALYKRLGVDCTALDPDGCLAVEPALRPIRDKISGGVHYPADGSGDALKFTQGPGGTRPQPRRLIPVRARHYRLRHRGRPGHRRGNQPRRDPRRFIRAGAGELQHPARPQCWPCRCRSTRPRAIPSPPRPLAGTAHRAFPLPMTAARSRSCRSATACASPATVEFDGYDTGLNATRGQMLVDGLGEIYPDYPREGRIEHWSGLRPLTPDGRPIIGRSRWRNLFLNTGHGPLGWTLAAGSGLAMAELVTGRTPSIDLAPFAAGR